MEHLLIRMCAEAMEEAIREALNEDPHGATEAFASVNTPNGWIEIDIRRCGRECRVSVYHDILDNGRECPTLCKAVADACPDWQEVQAEWEREAAEYESREQGLDPAFRSWGEFYGMVFKL